MVPGEPRHRLIDIDFAEDGSIWVACRIGKDGYFSYKFDPADLNEETVSALDMARTWIEWEIKEIHKCLAS